MTGGRMLLTQIDNHLNSFLKLLKYICISLAKSQALLIIQTRSAASLDPSQPASCAGGPLAPGAGWQPWESR